MGVDRREVGGGREQEKRREENCGLYVEYIF